MKVRLVAIWETISTSYWFIPSVMALLAALLAEAAIRAEVTEVAGWLRDVGWLYTNQPEGARALLSTVAGSMITVAGVTFSMTILAISHASAQIGPRLLRDFMSDRGTQVTLGTFVATFIYCLLVLRTVRSADEANTQEALSEFVPQIAVFTALLLAVLSVGVLIYFIHHVPATLSMAHLIERVSATLKDRILCLYPEQIGDSADGSLDAPLRSPELRAPQATLCADDCMGYLQYVDDVGLMEAAQEHDLVVELTARPGDFVGPGTELARLSAPGALQDATRTRLREAFVCGSERTPRQDVLFPALQLVEVAVRALSPGTNDPFTAWRCIDHLLGCLQLLAERRAPDPQRLDEEGRLRVLASSVSFEEAADVIFDGLRPHVSRDASCAIRLLRGLRRLTDSLDAPTQRAALERHLTALQAAAESRIDDPRDRSRIREAATPPPTALRNVAGEG